MQRGRATAWNSIRALQRVHWLASLSFFTAAASSAARLAMDWIAGMARRSSAGDVQSANIQKLRGYHELAKASDLTRHSIESAPPPLPARAPRPRFLRAPGSRGAPSAVRAQPLGARTRGGMAAARAACLPLGHRRHAEIPRA